MKSLFLSLAVAILWAASAAAQVPAPFPTVVIDLDDLTPEAKAKLGRAGIEGFSVTIAARAGAIPVPAAYQKRHEHPADLDRHLIEVHGFNQAAVAEMSLETKLRLHDESHDRMTGRAMTTSSVATTTSSYQSTYTQSSSTCVGPNCGAAQAGKVVSQPLFLPNFQPFGGKFRPFK